MAQTLSRAEQLLSHATVAVIGGGPAGSLFAIYLIRLAKTQNKHVRVVLSSAGASRRVVSLGS